MGDRERTPRSNGKGLIHVGISAVLNLETHFDVDEGLSNRVVVEGSRKDNL